MSAIPAKKVKRRGVMTELRTYCTRVLASLEEVKGGNVKKFKTAADLLKALNSQFR